MNVRLSHRNAFRHLEVNFQSRNFANMECLSGWRKSPSKSWRCYWTELVMLSTRSIASRKTLPIRMVAYEHGLNTAVNKLRDLLGDSARSPRFVETLPRSATGSSRR